MNTELLLRASGCLHVLSSCHPNTLRGYTMLCGHWKNLRKRMWTREGVGVCFLLQATFLFLFFPPGWHASPSVLNNGDNYTFKGSHCKPLERLRNPSVGNHEKMDGAGGGLPRETGIRLPSMPCSVQSPNFQPLSHAPVAEVPGLP